MPPACHAIQHAALFSPTIATLLAAINAGFLFSWPLLTAANVSKYLTETPATHKGHLCCIWQNVRSTKQSTSHEEDVILKEAKTHLVYAVILDTTHKQGWGYSDITGQYPQAYVRGNKYIFVFYSWDANALLMEPMQSKNDYVCMLWVYKHMYDKLDKVGFKPKSTS